MAEGMTDQGLREIETGAQEAYDRDYEAYVGRCLQEHLRDLEAADVLTKIEKACEMVSALCKPRGSEGWRNWTMSIPARPDYDPDLVIASALGAARDFIQEHHTQRAADAAGEE